MSPTPLLLLLLLCGTCYCSCPDSWTSYGSSCYYFTSQLLTCIEAASHCVQLGGNLVEINNLIEEIYVRTTLTSLNVLQAWIGLKYNQQQDQWLLKSTDAGSCWAFAVSNNQNGNEGGVAIGISSLELPSVCEKSST
ncbi:C-type lectin domain family 7 member A-like [Pomacea canaliculata]|uniref:C-type lectin domain family 7 member A-like n=1 Tax=Pomacea canaliculata TaxID=400727 RepID=UPI000D737452|nr:C-type lectin domain family 7 member A-like [Pomacea canaliculata]